MDAECAQILRSACIHTPPGTRGPSYPSSAVESPFSAESLEKLFPAQRYVSGHPEVHEAFQLGHPQHYPGLRIRPQPRHQIWHVLGHRENVRGSPAEQLVVTGNDLVRIERHPRIRFPERQKSFDPDTSGTIGEIGTGIVIDKQTIDPRQLDLVPRSCEHLRLALEMKIERRPTRSCSFHDVIDRRLGKTPVGKALVGRGDETMTCLRLLRLAKFSEHTSTIYTRQLTWPIRQKQCRYRGETER